ncbi:cutinase family protein [Rhodococcoides yunnanense]|uniref:cutinase family protein n=1 Tax=Rhodococcoides yunnanense TaxID=278209 RepID=UPI000933A2A2|nr:cutinase family protein [Rhodococcus yunnanensis]
MPRSTDITRRIGIGGTLLVAAAASLISTAPAAGAAPADTAAACPDVQLVFARGSGEVPGLGIVGDPLATKLKAALPSKTVDTYAVDYDANWSQKTAPDGATDITRVVTEISARCSDTTFVLGGYSQGASATAIALGVPTDFGVGEVVPEALAPRIAAVVTFGDPLGMRKQTIEQESALYGDRAKTYCTDGDPVCGAGVNVLAHLSYVVNSSIPDAVTFASSKVLASKN